MDREEEIVKAALDYANNLDDIKPTDEFSRNLCIALGQAFMKGAEWADEHQAEKDLHKSIYKAGFLDGFEDAVEGQYEKGYEQAEKDLELTVDDIMKLDALLIEMWNQSGNKYQEVLKRFKDLKNGTTK